MKCPGCGRNTTVWQCDRCGDTGCTTSSCSGTSGVKGARSSKTCIVCKKGKYQKSLKTDLEDAIINELKNILKRLSV